jgi:hypothetical protein
MQAGICSHVISLGKINARTSQILLYSYLQVSARKAGSAIVWKCANALVVCLTGRGYR